MITAHRKQAPQKEQSGAAHLSNIPVQAQLPQHHLPANEAISIPYQAREPAGDAVVQCCGFGKWLREKFCCGDTDVSESPQADGPYAAPEHTGSPPISTEHTPPSRTDGPCAVAALKGLGWNTAGDGDRLKIQTAEFGRLGQEVTGVDMLRDLDQVMILFFRPGDEVPFHVMYTDGAGNLCGKNNDLGMLGNNLCPELSNVGQMESELLKISLEYIEWNLKNGMTLKYVTWQQYQEAP